MSQCKVALPVIFDDLRSEEAIFQITAIIDEFNLSTQQTVDHINNLINSKTNIIQYLEQRLNTIDYKIKKIKGTNKPIKILSSSKYPLLSNNIDGESMCKNDYQDIIYAKQSRFYKIQHQAPILDEAIIKNRSRFFLNDQSFIKRQNKESFSVFQRSINEKLYSTSSLLLFNTAQHLHKKFSTKNLTSQYPRKQKKAFSDLEKLKTSIDDAPISILERDKTNDSKKEDITFKPILGVVPNIDVPEILPDLAGIVDITYNQTISSIAPSSTTVEIPVELPDIQNGTTTNEMTNLSVSCRSETTNNSLINSDFVSEAIQNQMNVPNTNEEEKQSSYLNENVPNLDLENNTNETNNSILGGRSSLLDEIRNFGGDKKKLKRIENRKIETKKKKQEAKEASLALSMGDQLRNALNDRRKFISDSKTEIISAPKFSESTILDKLSIILPKSLDETDHSSDENNPDWDD